MQRNGLIEKATRIIRGEEERQEEKAKLFSYIVYDNKDEENTKVLITVNSESGIEYIQCPNGNKINGNGKQKVGLDYGVKKDERVLFKIKEIGKQEQEEEICVTEEMIEKTAVQINILTNVKGYAAFNFEKNLGIEGYNKYYYKIGTNNTWVEGTEFFMFDYDVIQNKYVNDDDTITIYAKIVNNANGNEVIASRNIDVIDEVEEEGEIESESLIKAINQENLKTGKYKIKIKDKENTEYNVKLYNIVGDTEIPINTFPGVEEDVGTANGYAQNMIILKVNGDLTVQEGKTLTAYGNSYGGPKGMFIYCTGTVTNNGTISMTARGAKAVGQDV